jgi:hypothetical protein
LTNSKNKLKIREHFGFPNTPIEVTKYFSLMETYVTQLVEDIKNAGRMVPIPLKRKLSFEEEMEAVEHWACGSERPQSFSRVCNLPFEQFPPVDQLKEEEMRSIIKAIEDMFETWNHQVCLPENIPVAIAYPLVVGLMNEEAWYLPRGAICHDFCTGYSPECELKEYCSCLEYWNKPLINLENEE